MLNFVPFHKGIEAVLGIRATMRCDAYTLLPQSYVDTHCDISDKLV